MLPTRRSQNWLPGIFNDFFGNEWMEKSTSPAINIIENDKEYKVVNQDDILAIVG